MKARYLLAAAVLLGGCAGSPLAESLDLYPSPGPSEIPAAPVLPAAPNSPTFKDSSFSFSYPDSMEAGGLALNSNQIGMLVSKGPGGGILIQKSPAIGTLNDYIRTEAASKTITYSDQYLELRVAGVKAYRLDGAEYLNGTELKVRAVGFIDGEFFYRLYLFKNPAHESQMNAALEQILASWVWK